MESPVRRPVVIVLVALGVFVTGEIATRAFGLVDRVSRASRLLYAPGPSVDLPYVLRPNVSATPFGIQVRTNGLGLRGPAQDARAAPAVRRVAVVGDSVVFGQDVVEDDTLAAALARRLARGGERWEGLNGGVPGYDAVSESLFLDRVIAPLRPDVVIVGACLNDYDVTPTYGPTGLLVRKELEERDPTLVDRIQFVTLLQLVRAWWHGELASQIAEHAAAQRASQGATIERLGRLTRDQHLKFYRAPVPKYWDRLRAAYRRMKQTADAGGFRLLVAIFPERWQIADAEPDETPQRRLLAVCAETGLACRDLAPAFRAAGVDLFADGQHPTARGFAVAADDIATALETP
jgi:lysophospholipase L1-like esterase